MNVAVQEISPCQKKLTIQLSTEEVNKEYQAVLRDLRQNVAIPGFRKGKASLATIKRRFAKELKNEVKEHLLEHSLKDALLEQQISPVGTPSLNVNAVTVNENQPLAYEVEVEFLPPIELTDYKGVAIQKPAAGDVPEGSVTLALENLQRQHAVNEPVDDDHPIVMNDSVTIDYTRSLDGEPFGEPVTNYTIWLGVDAVLNELSQALLGKKSGEEFSFSIHYGEDTPNKAFAGKTMLFTGAVVNVEKVVLPALDDEFAKDLEHDSLDALKQKLAEDLRARLERDAIEAAKQQILMKLAEQHVFDVPPSLLREQKKAYPDQDEEELKKRLRAGILLAKIQAQENLTVSDEEVDERVHHLAMQNQVAVAAMRSYLESQGGLDRLRREILDTKTFDLLYAHATLV